MQVIVGILIILICLEFLVMGITWIWELTMSGAPMILVGTVTVFFVFRIVKALFKFTWIATILSIASAVFLSWVVMWEYNVYYSLGSLKASGMITAGQIIHREANLVGLWCVWSVAILITAFRARSACLSNEEVAAKREKVLVAARSLWDTLILFTYGEYYRHGKQVDIVFVLLPFIGVAAVLIGVWQLIAG